MMQQQNPKEEGTPSLAKKHEQALTQKERELELKNVGRPDRPEWDSLLGEDGMMDKKYQLGDTLNRDFMGQMREDGLRKPGEASAWRNMMDQQVDRQAGQASAGAQSQTQNAMSQMAMMGGLRGGAAERMAGRGVNQANLAKQNVLGQRLNLDLQDEQMRKGDLKSLGDAEMNVANFDRQGQQFNIGNTLNENLQKRAESTNAYNEQMRAWAAEKTAAATPSGGGGKK